MSDRMRLIPFNKLMEWISAEYQRDQAIFGISVTRFFKKENKNNIHIFDGMMEIPFGPAAGPNTQLAQNIIAAYVAGSRYFELKTVQIIDGEDLRIEKPCILANDEGYNTEWSTELTVPEALAEYIKAWFALSIISREYGLGDKDGFIFNMSVGYDFAGITQPKIDNFIEGLKKASTTPVWAECKKYVIDNIANYKNIDAEYIDSITDKVSKSITLSTLHGCPPQEIEKIASYLISIKKLHTYVKCNPTLLGYDFARNTLDKMGYDYLSFDDHHFKNDLQFRDAIPMIKRLQASAKENKVNFGLKISNTFPVEIKHHELPGQEMYLSGRALYPLSINLAYQLSKEFNGKINLSYSGGADAFNVQDIYETGIMPITCVTTVLKPGGYARFNQIAHILEQGNFTDGLVPIKVDKLKQVAESSITNEYHLKNKRDVESRKLSLPVPLTNCFIAPCIVGCPINQDIPEYTRLVSKSRYLEALALITKRNPLPFITGTLCAHPCMEKCTRIDYEETVQIRQCKLVAAEGGFAQLIDKLPKPVIESKFKVAIIGGGPAGMAAGYFLGQNGVDVTIFETRAKLGGIIEHIIPNFRIPREAIDNDVKLLERMGVKFELNCDAKATVEEYQQQGFDYIVLAIGALKPGSLQLSKCDKALINVLEFLETYNQAPGKIKLGKRVAVIGGGNTAMDAARTAKRIKGVEKVYVVYRRTLNLMPADKEELNNAIADGVKFIELVAPVLFIGGVLQCQKMKLGAKDTSGRPSPVAIDGDLIDLQVDDVILAIGEKVDNDYLIRNNIGLSERGKIVISDINETTLKKVFVAGDANLGPATIVESIAEGTKVARAILTKELNTPLDLSSVFIATKEQIAEIKDKKGELKTVAEKDRCLECNYICNICSEVCPNRANVQITIPGMKDINQILHIDGMCNECGNCETFCPYSSAPYKDKFTLYWSQSDFEDSKNNGFVELGKNKFKVRIHGIVKEVTFDETGKWDCPIDYWGNTTEGIRQLIWTTYTAYKFMFVNGK
jgi:putative selenate reductase